MDGLDDDADVAFVLTTNRVDVLEEALALRPGRIDLAVPIPLPTAELRARLFARAARALPLTAAGCEAAAEAAAGTTGSFPQEAVGGAGGGCSTRGRTERRSRTRVCWRPGPPCERRERNCAPR